MPMPSLVPHHFAFALRRLVLLLRSGAKTGVALPSLISALPICAQAQLRTAKPSLGPALRRAVRPRLCRSETEVRCVKPSPSLGVLFRHYVPRCSTGRCHRHTVLHRASRGHATAQPDAAELRYAIAVLTLTSWALPLRDNARLCLCAATRGTAVPLRSEVAPLRSDS